VLGGTGAAALTSFQTHPAPRSILLDLMMPVMNSWQFLERRTADPALAIIPVVVLSAQEGLTDHEKNQLDVHLYLRKPISMERLFR
jgi:CheY-like chemotaxis protein